MRLLYVFGCISAALSLMCVFHHPSPEGKVLSLVACILTLLSMHFSKPRRTS